MRHSFLEFLKRRNNKHNDFGNRTNELKCENILYNKIVLLESLGEFTANIQDIPHAIIGGHAISIHGHPRTTSDVDILVSPTHAKTVAERMALSDISTLTIGGLSGTAPNGTPVDLVSLNEPWADEAIATAVNTPHGKVVAKPYLVLMKLWASRGAQDDTDMLYTLKGMSDQEVQQVRDLVKKHLPNEVEDLESMISMREYV